MKLKIFYLVLTLTSTLSPVNWTAIIEDVIELSPLGNLIYKEIKNNSQANIDELYSPNKPSKDNTKNNLITFKDIVGLDEILIEVKETVEFLKNPTKFVAMGAQLPKGILLEGTPGTGKTLIAQAIAGEADCSFYPVSGSDFHKKYIGDGPDAIRSLFNTAKQNAPAVIFIDEIDAIGSRRSTDTDSAAASEFRAMVNELLSQMDGFHKNSSVIIIAATNLASNLDPALLRPGRFTRIIKVSLPSQEAREAILKFYIEKLPPENISFSIAQAITEIAKQTQGASPADLKNIINEAVLIAIRNNNGLITNSHLLSALDRIQLGIKNNITQSNDELKQTAYHEAGHAITAILNNIPIARVSIEARGHNLGSTFLQSNSDTSSNKTKEQLLNEIMICQGGGVAEKIIFKSTTLGISQDQKQAEAIARTIVEYFGTEKFPGISITGISETMKYEIDKEVITILTNSLNKTVNLLSSNIELLNKLAEQLLIHKTLSEKEVYAAISLAKPREALQFK